MLKLILRSAEFYDEDRNEFLQGKEHVLQLEHSLVSISKWESKWKKPFLSKTKKTYQERCDYVRCMTITQNVPPYLYRGLTDVELNRVEAYMQDPMTATIIRPSKGGGGGGAITSEEIYYWMIEYGIPFSCEKWNFNRLMALINLCGRKANERSKGKKNKIRKNEMAQRMSELNDTRRAMYKTKG